MTQCRLLTAMAMVWATSVATASAPEVAFFEVPGSVKITIGGKPFADFVYQDLKIPRPYFTGVHSPSGLQTTRNHPPLEGKDPTDHAEFHPGIWMAFGDVSGADFWRNRAEIVHDEFLQPPRGGAGAGSFIVRRHYQSKDKRVCDETCGYSILVRPEGYLLIVDSEFESSLGDFVFGDQEEMGLGVRVATAISVRQGSGKIVNSHGGINEKQVWGKPADWCAYSGSVDGKPVGVLLTTDPGNFRPSWFHARDYGLLVANPFGRNAFTKEPKSKLLIKKHGKFRLRFGVLIFGDGTTKAPDFESAYKDFLSLIAKPVKQ